MLPEFLPLSVAALVVALGAFVQTSIGFGMAIVAAPLLFSIDPAFVPAPMIIATLTNALFTCWHYRSSLVLGPLSAAMIARVPGSIVGAWLLLMVSIQVLAILIAVVIIAGIVLSALRVAIPFTRVNLALAGFCSGVMGTSTSIGGPPIALVMQGQGANRIRGNLSAFFIFSSLTSLAVLAPTARLDQKEWLLGLAMVLPAWLGSWGATKFNQGIPEAALRIATFALCGASVVLMLFQYLRN